MKKIIFLVTVIVFCLSGVVAQDMNEVGRKYIYEFRDGTTIIGTFIKDEGGNIYINDLTGKEIYLPRVMVAQIHPVTKDNIRDGEYWFPNLHDTRYFFSPSAFGLEQGEGYYSHSYWILWQAQWGITDELSIGGGTAVMGVPTTVNAKYSFSLDNEGLFHGAFGWFYVGDLFGVSGGAASNLINMPYGVLTRGTKENNFTIGLGYNMTGDNLSSSERPVLNVGGTFRTGRRFAVVFEGWVFSPFDPSNSNLLGGPGIRYFRKINRVTARNGAGASTWDFQLLMSPEFDGIIPMFGASRRF